MRISAILSFAFALLGFKSTVEAQCQDYWDGTAPFCDGGPCRRGWHAAGTSDYGGGGYCITGHKVLCKCDLGGTPPGCSQPTRTSCVGLILFCNNGCGWYACGACFFGTWDAQEDESGRWKNWTRDDIRKALAATDKMRLTASLYKMDVPIPPDASNKTILDLADKVIDGQLRDMKFVDATASYNQWESPDRWIPLKRPGASRKEGNTDNQEVSAEL